MVFTPDKFYAGTDYSDVLDNNNKNVKQTTPVRKVEKFEWNSDRFVKSLAKKNIRITNSEYHGYKRKTMSAHKQPFKKLDLINNCGQSNMRDYIVSFRRAHNRENVSFDRHPEQPTETNAPKKVLKDYFEDNRRSEPIVAFTPIKKKKIDQQSDEFEEIDDILGTQENHTANEQLNIENANNNIDNDNLSSVAYDGDNNRETENDEELWARLAEYDPDLINEKNAPLGLINLGNTCYMNAIVQILFSFDFFMKDVIETYTKLSEYIRTEIENQLPITYNFIELYLKYQSRENRSVIEEFLTLFQNSFCSWVENFKSNEQQDAAEFFTLILDNIKQEIDQNHSKFFSPASSYRNPIDRCFEYEILAEAECPQCRKPCAKSVDPNYKSNTFHLPLDSNVQVSILRYFNNEISRSKCPDCDENFIIKKRFVKLPKILFIQMLRYSEDGSKDNTAVPVAHTIYLPKQFIRIQSCLMSPLSTPYKTSLTQSYNSILKEKNSSVTRRLEFDEPINSGSTSSRLTSNSNANIRSMNLNSDENNGAMVISATNLNRQTNNETDTNDQVVFDQSTECERYQLVSVICHQGPSITCGHYTCYVYNFDYQKWYHCDDSIITQVPFKQLEKNSLTTGYCYFYARTDHDYHS